jgi:hypothetical protein
MTHKAWAHYKRKGVIIPGYEDLVARKLAEQDSNDDPKYSRKD